MPFTIGAIDCTHVRIAKPKMDGDEYINRKNYPSINVQATCDAAEKFTSICAEWPGSVHDSRILSNSSIPEVMQRINNAILIGDSGYGISPWLITPYENPQTVVKQNFNKIYATDRVIIERCFGQLKRRFPILHYKVRTKLTSIPGVITCCAILHNIAKFLNDADEFPEQPENDQPFSNAERTHTSNTQSRTRIRAAGQAKRNQIAQMLLPN
jgi:hypothetical protein